MNKAIAAEKDPKMAYIMGCMDGEKRVLDLLLTIIDNTKTYSMRNSSRSVYVDKDALRSVIEALRKVSIHDRPIKTNT